MEPSKSPETREENPHEFYQVNNPGFVMDGYKGVWIGVLALIVVGALGLWWLAASQELDMSASTSTSTVPGIPSTSGLVSVAKKTESNDIASIVKDLSSASQFAAIFTSTGVAASLSGKGPYTVFVPSNDAFAAAAPGTIKNLSAAEKKRLVQYHIVSGRSIDPDAVSTGAIQALSGDALNFQMTDQTARVNSAYIIKAYPASNGVVYLVSAILVPPRR